VPGAAATSAVAGKEIIASHLCNDVAAIALAAPRRALRQHAGVAAEAQRDEAAEALAGEIMGAARATAAAMIRVVANLEKV
jgi:hypothetical protein